MDAYPCMTTASQTHDRNIPTLLQEQVARAWCVLARRARAVATDEHMYVRYVRLPPMAS